MADTPRRRRRRRRRRGGQRADTAAAGASGEATTAETPSTESVYAAAEAEHSGGARRSKHDERGKRGDRGGRAQPDTVFGIPRMLFVIGLGILVATLGIFVLDQVGGSSSDGEDLDLSSVETFPDQGRRHLEPDESFVYNSNPPTSGPHAAVGVAPGIYDSPQPFASLLPVLEQGGIVIYYRPDLVGSAGEENLRTLVQDGLDQEFTIVLTADDRIDDPIVATAWRHALRLDAFDRERLRDFILGFGGLFVLELKPEPPIAQGATSGEMGGDDADTG